MDLRAEGREWRVNRVGPNVHALSRFYQNGFRGVHPCAAFMYYFGLFLLLTLQYHPAITAGALLLVTLLNIALGMGRKMFRYSWIYLVVFVITVALNIGMNHRGIHIYGYLFDQPLTVEAVIYGVQNALLLIAVLILFQSFSEVVTTQKWLYLFSRFVPKAALMTAMAMRFVPLLMRRLRDIADAQAWRDIEARQRSLRSRITKALHQVRILLTWSLEEAVQTADSMLARGYGSSGRRTTFHLFRISFRDIVLMMLFTGILAVSIAGWSYGIGRLDIYPVLGDFAWDVMDAGIACVIWLYTSVPIWLEGKERWRWRSWKFEA